MIKRSINIKGELHSFDKPLVMGIVNMTPDSFFDGGKYNDLDQAKLRVDKMVKEGVDILDIGGYSTRPGADVIPSDVEWNRIKDIIEYSSSKYKNIIISVDSFRSDIIRKAFDSGADIINDISGGNYDKNMFKTASELRMPYILMHIRGTPKTMLDKTDYKELIPDIMDYFKKKIDMLYDLDVVDVIIDPGFGFAKAGMLAKSMVYLGASLVLSGVSEMLFPLPKPKEFKSEQDPQLSFSFSGTQNTSRAGTPVPIVYGEIVTGSVVISGAIDTQQVQA